MGSTPSTVAVKPRSGTDDGVKPHSCSAWIADVYLQHKADTDSRSRECRGVCPARLDVANGACALTFVWPGGFTVKIYIDAPECAELLRFADHADAGASIVVKGAVLDTAQTPEVDYLLPVATRFVLDPEAGVMKKVPVNAAVVAHRVEGGLRWNFVFPSGSQFPSSFAFTLANSERVAIRDLFASDARTARKRSTPHKQFGAWSLQSDLEKEMARHENVAGIPYGPEVPAHIKLVLSVLDTNIVGSHVKLATEAKTDRFGTNGGTGTGTATATATRK